MSDNFPAWETPYGFKWGPAIIERMAELPSGLVLSLKTDAGKYLQWKPSHAAQTSDCEVCASTGAIACTHGPYA